MGGCQIARQPPAGRRSRLLLAPAEQRHAQQAGGEHGQRGRFRHLGLQGVGQCVVLDRDLISVAGAQRRRRRRQREGAQARVVGGGAGQAVGAADGAQSIEHGRREVEDRHAAGGQVRNIDGPGDACIGIGRRCRAGRHIGLRIRRGVEGDGHGVGRAQREIERGRGAHIGVAGRNAVGRQRGVGPGLRVGAGGHGTDGDRGAGQVLVGVAERAGDGRRRGKRREIIFRQGGAGRADALVRHVGRVAAENAERLRAVGEDAVQLAGGVGIVGARQQ